MVNIIITILLFHNNFHPYKPVHSSLFLVFQTYISANNPSGGELPSVGGSNLEGEASRQGNACLLMFQ